MDLEAHARALYKTKKTKNEIIKELSILAGSEMKAEAIYREIKNTENLTDPNLAEILNFQESGVSAGVGGLGCRGAGDFYIHHKIAELLENLDAVVDPKQQDDGGVVQVKDDFITVAVDGMHSRLSHFPFIAGFHVARAAIRDILVMGGQPVALFSDIHIGNDGDVAKVFDYTAGIAAVGELTEIPLVAGSTLRIGGDLVLGDRLTGCAGCVGISKKITPRKDAQVGDVLVMTEGSGGGTIATTALYNGISGVVEETLDIKIIQFGKKLLDSEMIWNVHALTDVTNGGLRGDAFEIANTAKVSIIIFKSIFNSLINPRVLKMLTDIGIDPLGVSIDSLLIILPKEHVNELLDFIQARGIKAAVVGKIVESAFGPEGRFEGGIDGPVVYLAVGKQSELELDNLFNEQDLIKLEPEFREAPYTPIKKVVNKEVNLETQARMNKVIDKAMTRSLNKKAKVKKWIIENGRV